MKTKVYKRPLQLLAVVMLALGAPAYATKCTGKANCTACTNCKYCQHCSKQGGSCGVRIKGGKASKSQASRSFSATAAISPAPVFKPSTSRSVRSSRKVAEATFSGKCVVISDGDTVQVMHNGRAEKIRLWGIDCPEKTQPFGTKARQFTGDAAFGKTVTVKVMDVDRYGRTVGVVYLPNGKALNDELVRAGLAWWYRQYSPAATYLGRYEQQGKAARRGLWVDGNPTPPWDYRRR